MLSISTCAAAACLLEVTARKPGNVHRFHDFDDVTYFDFLLSAAVLGPCLEQVGERGVGETTLEIIRRTREVTTTNTNLGIALLLTPLAAVPRAIGLQEGVEAVLQNLTVADADAVYRAIRLAQPSGLGRVADQDISQSPTRTLRQVMELAADRDLVARQIANGYHELFDIGLPALLDGYERRWPFEETIVHCQLKLMALCPDSLIARKRGRAEAEESARLAVDALAENMSLPLQRPALRRLDAWLRAERHQRNPGTTADVVTASLFAAFREGLITFPLDRPFTSSGEH